MDLKSHEFTLTYDTSDTEEHIIDAVSLGKSLVSMSLAVKQAGKILNGESSYIEVKVKAHSEGSFAIEYVVEWLSSGGIDVLQAMGISSPITAIAHAGVIEKIKQLKNRIIVNKARKLKGDGWQLELDDGTKVDCSDSEDKLLDNHFFLKELEKTIYTPVVGCENVTVKITDQDGQETKIPQAEVDYFRAPPRKDMQETDENIKQVNIEFVQINLEGKTGWKIKLPDGEEVSARMDAEDFLERISSRKRSFSKGDVFQIKLKTVEKTLDGKTTTSRNIIEVVRHRVAKKRKIV